ncbi:MAG: FG-GAP repeat protein [Polyangiales bacterium]
MRFAARHGSVGDFDGDRIGDYIITNENWPFVDIYRGNRQQMLMYDRTIRPVVVDRGIGVDAFVGFVSDAPDLDGDGRSEFVATCRRCGVSLPSDPEWGRGYVFVYRLMGSPSSATLPDLVLRGYNDGWDWSGTFGTDVAAGDYNGDGFDDLVIGDPESHETRDRPYRGKLHVVFGGGVWGEFRRVVVFGESITADEGVGGSLAATVNRSSGMGG